MGSCHQLRQFGPGRPAFNRLLCSQDDGSHRIRHIRRIQRHTGVQKLLSEDHNAGQVFEGATVVNPFA